MAAAFRPEDLRFCYLGVYFGQFETKGCLLTHEGDENHQYIAYRSPANEQETKFHFRPPVTGDIESAVLDAYFDAICRIIDPKIATVKYIDGLTVVFPTIPKHLNIDQLEIKLEFKLSKHVRLQRRPKRVSIVLEHEMWGELIENEHEKYKIEGDYAVLHCSAYSFISHQKEVCRDLGFSGGLLTADVLGWKGVEHLAKVYGRSSEQEFQEHALFGKAKRELGVEDYEGLINLKNSYSALKVAKFAEHMGDDAELNETLADFGDKLLQKTCSFVGKNVTILLNGRLFDFCQKLFATSPIAGGLKFAKYKEEGLNDTEVTAALHAATIDGKKCDYQEKQFF